MSSLPRPGPQEVEWGELVLLGPPPSLGGGHLGKLQNQPHTSALFPWLHCVSAPEGSVAAGTALTPAATLPGPQQRNCRPH